MNHLAKFVPLSICAALSTLIFTASAATDFYVVCGLEQASNPVPFMIYELEQDTGHLSPVRTITTDCWFDTCVVSPDGCFAAFWTHDMAPRTEVARELTREERKALLDKTWMEHLIVVDLTKRIPDRVLPISHKGFFGNTLAYDPEGHLCAFTPDYEPGPWDIDAARVGSE